MEDKIKLDTYNIRKADLKDIDGIKSIADKNTHEIGFVLRPALEEKAKQGTLLVAEYNNQVLGFCNYNARRDGINVIYEICVDNKYRGNGIAKKLIENMPIPIRLKCPIDNESNKFYEHIGFKHMGIDKGKKRPLNIWEYGGENNYLF